MKRLLTSIKRLWAASCICLLLCLPRRISYGETGLTLSLPQGDGSVYMQLLEGQDVLALPLRLAGDGLNETLFLCSAQLDIGYDAARLTYLGTGETLAQTYGCRYTDPASGQEEPQTWVVNGQEPGTVRLAFASGFPCRTEEAVLTLYFALQESALPGDALIFSIQNAALTFADAKGQVISDTMLSTASGPLLLPSSPSAVPSVQTLQTVADPLPAARPTPLRIALYILLGLTLVGLACLLAALLVLSLPPALPEAFLCFYTLPERTERTKLHLSGKPRFCVFSR